MRGYLQAVRRTLTVFVPAVALLFVFIAVSEAAEAVTGHRWPGLALCVVILILALSWFDYSYTKKPGA